MRWTILTALCTTWAATGCDVSRYLPPDLPPATTVERTYPLEQGWSDEARAWFHHASQGSDTLGVPYDWFMALEQPELRLGESPPLHDPSYLARFGFIPSLPSADNPDGLPVGFTRQPGYVDPTTDKSKTALGFTCAACHTGQLEYGGTRIPIEGGPAMTDLGKVRRALGLAVVYTKYIPGRFNRFAKRLLGENWSQAKHRDLKAEVDEFITAAQQNPELRAEILDNSTEEGFTRLDALGRIGNFVFGVELDPNNVTPLRAPVNYPHIWDAPWFEWVQYDGSIGQPMVRNAGEAMGLRARVNFTDPGAKRFDSAMRVQTLYELEQQIAGPQPFKGLRAPRWPTEVLGRIDPDKAARGRTLYLELCQGCHLPPVDSPAFFDDRHWSAPNAANERYLRLAMIDIDYVGTDPGQARIMVERTVDTGPLGLGKIGFAAALGKVVELTVDHWYDTQSPSTPPADRDRMNGNRPNALRTEMNYKARPLDGVWATAPYLHNGSVPNLYLLLSPVSERPADFYLGSRAFDPECVGFEYGELAGAFHLRTAEPGNSNAGHEFRGPEGGAKGHGVVGRGLASSERFALIEFLKTQ